jgi:hypothetical protein
MGTRITGGDDKPKKPKFVPNPRAPWDKYPRPLEVGCMNRAHSDIVNFVIPAGRKNAKCPKCGRRAGRE